MADIYLYGGEANPNDIELRDPTVLDVEALPITGTAGVTFKVAALAVSGTNLLAITGTGAVTFRHPVVSGSDALPEVPAIGGPYRHRVPVHQPAPPPRIRIPVHVSLEPTVVETRPLEPVIAEGAADNQEALVALYASGALSDVEFAALIAA